jgi:hypothetical protein
MAAFPSHALHSSCGKVFQYELNQHVVYQTGNRLANDLGVIAVARVCFDLTRELLIADKGGTKENESN